MERGFSQITTHQVASAPKPLGNYSHAVSVGNLIFVAGIASRDFKTNQIPGLKLDSAGKKIGYDIRQETAATLKNIETILKEVGSSLDHVVEVNTYLLDMGDFEAYNSVYNTVFSKHHPARTTVGVQSLPGFVSIEMKVVAVKP